MFNRGVGSSLFVLFLALACGGTDDGGGELSSSAGNAASDGGSSAGSGVGSGISGSAAISGAGGAVAGVAGKSDQGGGGKADGAAGKGGGGTANGGATNGGGTSASAGYGPSSACKAWPAATGSTQKVSKTQSVAKDFDGMLQRFVGDGLGDGAQGEDQKPLFELADGATLENVIIGAPAADGIHCLGSCTLKNVWWEDVGEDAATFKGKTASQVMAIDCGGAKSASDKVFQHNGPGTMTISNFFVSSFGKLYRSCGNCSSQYARHVVISNISAQGGKDLAGVNENYGDTATFSGILVSSGTVICQRYTGNDTGAEPPTTGKGPDTKVCLYQTSDIHPL